MYIENVCAKVLKFYKKWTILSIYGWSTQKNWFGVILNQLRKKSCRSTKHLVTLATA